MPEISAGARPVRPPRQRGPDIEPRFRSRLSLIPADEIDPLWPPDTDIALTTQSGWVDACRGPTPLYLQAPLQAHRLIDLPLKKAVYAQLNWVADTDTQSLDQFGRRILTRARQSNPREIVLDLRLIKAETETLRTVSSPR